MLNKAWTVAGASASIRINPADAATWLLLLVHDMRVMTYFALIRSIVKKMLCKFVCVQTPGKRENVSFCTGCFIPQGLWGGGGGLHVQQGCSRQRYGRGAPIPGMLHCHGPLPGCTACCGCGAIQTHTNRAAVG